MNRMIVAALAAGSALSVAEGRTLGSMFDPPKASLIMQSTRTTEWLAVPRATVAQKSSRRIRLRGPWMDFVTSVTASNGVSARSLETSSQQVEMILDASEMATRGDMTLKLNITCPPIPLIDCRSSTTFPVRVFETGPIRSIQPYGTVPANTQVTFDLTGDALGVAKLLPRLLRLGNATILQQTATTMRVRGTTPSCGSVTVALTDTNDGDEFPYFHAATMQRVLAGTECAGGPAQPTLTYTQCTPPQIWDAGLHACRNP